MCQKKYAAVTAGKKNPLGEQERQIVGGGTGESLSMCFILVLHVNKHWDLIKAETLNSGCQPFIPPLWSRVVFGGWLCIAARCLLFCPS